MKENESNTNIGITIRKKSNNTYIAIISNGYTTGEIFDIKALNNPPIIFNNRSRLKLMYDVLLYIKDNQIIISYIQDKDRKLDDCSCIKRLINDCTKTKNLDIRWKLIKYLSNLAIDMEL